MSDTEFLSSYDVISFYCKYKISSSAFHLRMVEKSGTTTNKKYHPILPDINVSCTCETDCQTKLSINQTTKIKGSSCTDI